jgi:hypothetical protein
VFLAEYLNIGFDFGANHHQTTDFIGMKVMQISPMEVSGVTAPFP